MNKKEIISKVKFRLLEKYTAKNLLPSEEIINDCIDETLEAINFTDSSLELPVDKLQDIIEDTFNWQVQDMDVESYEGALYFGIKEGALAIKHYIDDKRKAIT